MSYLGYFALEALYKGRAIALLRLESQLAVGADAPRKELARTQHQGAVQGPRRHLLAKRTSALKLNWRSSKSPDRLTHVIHGFLDRQLQQERSLQRIEAIVAKLVGLARLRHHQRLRPAAGYATNLRAAHLWVQDRQLGRESAPFDPGRRGE